MKTRKETPPPQLRKSRIDEVRNGVSIWNVDGLIWASIRPLSPLSHLCQAPRKGGGTGNFGKKTLQKKTGPHNMKSQNFVPSQHKA